jgi:hypothetical protein
MAQELADSLASGTAPFQHSKGSREGKYGENLSVRTGPSSGNAVVEDWYEEVENYDFDNPAVNVVTPPPATAHFSAVVWKSTKKLGIAKARAADGKLFVVGTYFPPGNFPSKVRENVFPPRKN